MKIVITGGLGFVGRHLTTHLLAQGHQVVVTATGSAPAALAHQNLTCIQADTTLPGNWQDALQDAQAVINLTGRSIFKRWNTRYKEQIYKSRIQTTQNIVAALPKNAGTVLCSTSAVGYYGNRDDQVLDETAPAGSDFLAAVSIDWEQAALAATSKDVRVAIMRFGVVLGPNGGALAQMLPPFRLFVGGPLGNGRQWMAWMHIQDLIAAVDFILHNASCQGTFNFCTPHPVQNVTLARTLGQCLGRPAVLPAPAFMLKLVLGEFAGVLLASQRAVPENLLNAGFAFQFPELKDALRDLI